MVAELNFNLLENFHGWMVVLHAQDLLHKLFQWKSFTVSINPRKPQNFQTLNNLQYTVVVICTTPINYKPHYFLCREELGLTSQVFNHNILPYSGEFEFYFSYTLGISVKKLQQLQIHAVRLFNTKIHNIHITHVFT